MLNEGDTFIVKEKDNNRIEGLERVEEEIERVQYLSTKLATRKKWGKMEKRKTSERWEKNLKMT